MENRLPGQLDWFDAVETYDEKREQFRSAIRHLTSYEPLERALRDMTRHDASIGDIAQLMKEQGSNVGHVSRRFRFSTFNGRIVVGQGETAMEYSWAEAAREFVKMYWEERREEDDDL